MTFSLERQHKLEKGTGLASAEYYCLVSGPKSTIREEVRKRLEKHIYNPSHGQVAGRGITLLPLVLPCACRLDPALHLRVRA